MRYILFALLFFVPTVAFGAVQDGETGGYTRSSGSEVVSPLSIRFYGSEDTFGNNSNAYFFGDCMALGTCSYKVILLDIYNGVPAVGACHTVVDNENIDYTDLIPLVTGTEIRMVIFQTYLSTNCTNGSHAGVYDYDGGNALFIIIDPPIVNGITALRESTEQGFQNTTGETVGGAVVWAGDSFTKVIMGSALGVLLALRYWIFALVIIFIIVFFYKRARI